MTAQEFISRVNAEKHDQVTFSARLCSAFPGIVLVSASMDRCHYDVSFHPSMFDANFDFWDLEKARIVRAIVEQVEKVRFEKALKERIRQCPYPHEKRQR